MNIRTHNMKFNATTIEILLLFMVENLRKWLCFRSMCSLPTEMRENCEMCLRYEYTPIPSPVSRSLFPAGVLGYLNSWIMWCKHPLNFTPTLLCTFLIFLAHLLSPSLQHILLFSLSFTSLPLPNDVPHSNLLSFLFPTNILSVFFLSVSCTQTFSWY